MKLFLLSVFFLLSQTYAEAQQHPFAPMKNKAERGIKPAMRASQNKIHPQSAVRNHQHGPSTLFEYDAFGNVVSETTGTSRVITKYDPTGKYLIQELIYARDNQEAPFVLNSTELETTFNTQGVRTGVSGERIKEATFDSRGRATKVVWENEDYREQKYLLTIEYSWAGDKLARMEFIDNYPGEYQHYVYSNIDYTFGASNFNSMNLDLTEDLLDSEYATLMSFDILELAQGGESSTGLRAEARVTVAPDGRRASRILTEMSDGGAGTIFMKEEVALLDEYGSIMQKTEYYDAGIVSGFYKETRMYNEYGDCISRVSEDKEGEYESYFSEYYVRTYAEDGRPQSTALYNPSEAPENLSWTEFYDGYNPSSISAAAADGMVNVYKDETGKFMISAKQIQVNGAMIYRADGTFSCLLSAEDALNSIYLPSRGLYIVKVNTSQGLIVKKVVN